MKKLMLVHSGPSSGVFVGLTIWGTQQVKNLAIVLASQVSGEVYLIMGADECSRDSTKILMRRVFCGHYMTLKVKPGEDAVAQICSIIEKEADHFGTILVVVDDDDLVRGVVRAFSIARFGASSEAPALGSPGACVIDCEHQSIAKVEF